MAATKSTKTGGFREVDALLRAVHLSEKASRGESQGSYVFRVARNATKLDVAAAVARKFKVDVAKVRTSQVEGKRKRVGVRTGQTSNYKKAYVSLKKGQSIEFGAKS